MSQINEESNIEIDSYITFVFLSIVWYFGTGIFIAILFGFLDPIFWSTDLLSRNFIVWPMPVIWAFLGGIRLLSFEWFLIPLAPFITFYVVKKGYVWKNSKKSI